MLRKSILRATLTFPDGIDPEVLAVTTLTSRHGVDACVTGVYSEARRWKWPQRQFPPLGAYEPSERIDASQDFFRPSPHCDLADTQPKCGAVGFPHALRGLGRLDSAHGGSHGVGGRLLRSASLAGNHVGDAFGSDRR